jgi:sensor histidine kinase YesM
MYHKQNTEPGGFSFHFLISPRFRLLRHLLLLMIVTVMAVQQSIEDYLYGNTVYAISLFLTLIGIVYMNISVLAPRFLFKNKFLLYIGLALGVILLFLFMLIILQLFVRNNNLDFYQDIPPFVPFLNLVSSMISMGLFIAGSSTLLLLQKWVLHEHQIKSLEKVTMQSELDQLKNQINPHFLFNMLNNANELTKENPDKAADILFKLNDLLKYQINDQAKESVLLNEEILFLSDLLNLEKIRRDNFEFIISVKGNTAQVRIPPLLFITFVENALKHGNSQKSYIHLFFNIESEALNFVCINSRPTGIYKNKTVSGGIGLMNVKRRLELLYGQHYSLEIKESEIMYSVQLILSRKIINN